MKRLFVIILFVFGLFLIAGGIGDAIQGHRAPEATKMTVAEFIADENISPWVILTDAKINLLRAVAVSSGSSGKIKRLYAPIESNDAPQKDAIKVLIRTSDSEMIEVAQQMKDLSAGEQIKFLASHKKDLLREGAIEGRVNSHNSLKDSDLKEMRKLVGDLSSKFTVFDYPGLAPSFKRGILILCLGIGLTLLSLFMFKKKKKPVK